MTTSTKGRLAYPPNNVFWEANVPGLTPIRAPLPQRADVVVLGGGLTGLSAALGLAERGARVVVLECGQVSSGASGRNGGQVLTGVNPSFNRLVETLGIEGAAQLWGEGVLAVEDVATWIERYGIACGWHRGGHLAVATTNARSRQLHREAAALSKAGFSATWLDAQQVSEQLGLVGYRGGLFDPRSGTVNPYALTVGIAQAAVRCGAVILEETPGRVETGRGQLTVHGPGFALAAEHVLVATNAYLPEVVPTLRWRMHRVTGSMLATAPLDRSLASTLLVDRPAVFEESTRVAHFQRTPDDRIIFGGRVPPDTAPGDEAAGLTRLLHQVIPALREVPVDSFWQGPLALTASGLPAWGQTRDGLTWAGGYSGHGVALAVRLGRQLGDWLSGGAQPTWPPVLPHPFGLRYAEVTKWRAPRPSGRTWRWQAD